MSPSRSAKHLVCALALAAGVVAATAAGPAAAAPTGLTDTVLPSPAGNPLSSPTAIAPLPGDRALVLEKAGAVRILQADGTLAAADALPLAVCTGSEQGLLGAAADPAFTANGYVYLYYSRNAGSCSSSTGRFNRLSRFTMTGDTIDPASEVVLLDNLNIPAGNHNGGDVEFGRDGNLYVTIGDGGSNPRGGGGSAGQDLSLLNGKVLRITPTGGVPADNPFVGTPGAVPCATAGITTPTSAVCTEVYGYGLRNPYRFAFDPNAAGVRFFLNDVGQNTWEEVDEGGPGRNYGWNAREGFCVNGSSTNCSPAPGMTDPLTAYSHSTGCTYITAGAFVPNGLWDPAYDGGYLFADGGCGKMWLRTAAGTVDYGDPFAQTSGVITDMSFLTQGGLTALYYVTNGSGQLHRITLPARPPGDPGPGPGGGGPGGGSTPTPARCRIAAVKGLLASTARAAIRARHCTVRQRVVAMRKGRPVIRHGRYVAARSTKRPKRSPGPHRRWTLRVEHVVQKVGRSYPAGTAQSIWVGWESTPASIAGKPKRHFL